MSESDVLPTVTARKRILVMDDEASILELTFRMLSSHGFEVVKSTSGDAAVVLYREAKDAGNPFHAVILDLTVPEGMSGIDAFNAMKAYDPGVKAILSSGYSHEPVVLNYKQYGIAGVAPKPYKVKDLVATVQGVVDGI
jgi:DNA-binding NtrC family response regulator